MGRGVEMDGERFDTVVIGSGQAGLSAGYYLSRAGRRFLIVDANERVGGSWLDRYDSLRLFTPPWAVRLPGMRYPAKRGPGPTKDEMIAHLQAFASRFDLPVRTGVHIDRVSREGDRYVLSAGLERIEADHVVVASGADRDPRIPVFSRDLDREIVQLHSSAYRNPSQLRKGGVLVVGAGNSGADISLDLAPSHPTWLSGPHRGHVPVDIDRWFSQHVAFRLIRFVGLHVLTIRTPMGRKARLKYASQGDMLVRVKPKQILAAGIERVPRTVGVRDGMPVLEDGRVLDVANVIWCTGFRHDLSWIDLPIFGEDGELQHHRGVVTSEPGLYFVGLAFQYSAGSNVIPGIGRDARYVVRELVA
ncbi:MAG TPA: NAD(P)-binding domain-containing protein, partial [Actinomycetota bacterium]|nr:NAD(P)-binding domain-containing protein [Actinomycetota bacterium]